MHLSAFLRRVFCDFARGPRPATRDYATAATFSYPDLLMLASFEVELGGDAPFLSLPWQSEDGSLRFVNLRESDLSGLPEAADPGMRTALLALNAQGSPLLTAKCDLWSASTLSQEEQGFFPTARAKYASYVDVLWLDARLRSSFVAAERQMRCWTSGLRAAENEQASAEVILRACAVNGEAGFYWSVYVSGFGVDPAAAHRGWGEALLQVTAALLAPSSSPS